MSKYIPLTKTNASQNFKQKTEANQSVINEALLFLSACGIPTESLTARSLEMMAMSFLAVADVASSDQWPFLKTLRDKRSVTTRGIITWINLHFQENISSGSYDDVRRKHLKLPVLAEVVLPTKPGSARNDSQRGYAVADEFGAFARMIPDGSYYALLADKLAADGSLATKLSAARHIEIIPIVTPEGAKLSFTSGDHNRLQKAVVEQFLPRFGYGAELLYLGDTADKFKWVQQDKLRDLHFFELSHGELPDVVAYSPHQNWLFLIEAVHSTGPISPTRLLQLQYLCKECTAAIVFVTAFLDKATFRKFAVEIAWETEVWIADQPDHLIHFNGGKFLGPHLPEDAQ